MTNIGIFHVGPVQKYIVCARKTQDYWMGSYILSFLSAVALATVAEKIGGNAVVEPDTANDVLFGIVEKAPGDPQKHDFTTMTTSITGTLPNRFVGICDDKTKLQNAFQTARKNVHNTYAHLACKIRTTLESYLNPSLPNWKLIWDRQISDFVETLWAIHTADDDSYGDWIKAAERLFGARKGARLFQQIKGGEPGEKCSLCGERQALVCKSDDTRPHTFWQKVRQALKKNGMPYAFRDNERFCAPCTIKRLAGELYFKTSFQFPSTSAITMGSVLSGLADRWREKAVQEAADDFKNAFNDLELEGFPKNLEPLPVITRRLKNSIPEIFGWDSRAFMADSLQPERLEQDYDWTGKGDATKCRDLLRNLVGLQEFKPAKYYAAVMMDGDDMGKLKGSFEKVTEQQEFSRRLGAFSRRLIPRVTEEAYCARTVYFGGDEGIVLVALEDLLPMMHAMRAAFSGHIAFHPGQEEPTIDFSTDGAQTLHEGKYQYQTLGPGKTACIAAVVAHHQQSLLQVMEEARYSLEHVAKKLNGKDGFCITLMKRSGGTTRAQSKWWLPAGNETDRPVDVIGHLKEMKNLYRTAKGLQDAWLYDLEREKSTLEGLTYADDEIRRLARRHCHPSCHPRLDGLLDDMKRIHREYGGDIKGLNNLIRLEFAASYIAKGGGQ